MVVQLGYGVDHGQVRYRQDPFYGSRYGYGGFGCGPLLLSRASAVGASPFYCGWDDPFWYGGGDRQLCRIS